MNTPPLDDRRTAFISYAREDRGWAKETRRQLQRDGYTAFLDITSIENGEDWPERLRHVIEHSSLFLLGWSRFARSSAWVDHEWRHALQCGKAIRIETLDETPLPTELQRFHAERSPLGSHELYSFIRYQSADRHTKKHPRPSQLLLAEYGIVPFQGRDMESAEIESWCASGRPFEVLFLSGPAGMGKTRLMWEMCLRLAHQGWETGFAEPDKLPEAEAGLRVLCRYRMPLLLVFDYAEVHGTHLKRLVSLADDKRDGPPLRIVFVSRQLGSELKAWYEDLTYHYLRPGMLEYGSARTLALEPFGTSPAVRCDLYLKATEAFASHLGIPYEPPTLPDLTDDMFGRPLLIHMAALTALLGGHEHTPEGLVQFLLHHEKHYWRSLAVKMKVPGHLLPSIDSLVVIITLLGGLRNVRELQSISHPFSQVLQEVLNLTPTELRDMLQVVCECYEVAGHLEPLQPDLLGEWFVRDTLRENARFLLDLVTKMDDDAVCSTLTILNRIALDHPEGRAWIDAVLSLSFEERMAPLGFDVAKAVGDPLGQLLTERLRQQPHPVLARRLERQLPEYTVALRELRVVVVEQCLANLDPKEDLKQARLNSKLGTYLFDLGYFDRAAVASSDSVKTYKELVEDQGRVSYKPHLARSLDNLANALSALPRHQIPPELAVTEASDAAEQAVELYECLAQGGKTSVRIRLARSKNNLAVILWKTGERQRAVALMQGAIDLYRQLPEPASSRCAPDLAMCRNNLGTFYTALGRQDDALHEADEAVQGYRKLAARLPDAFDFFLAVSLNTYANQLFEAYSYLTAREVADEALTLWRKLATQRPKEFNTYLALALTNFGQILSECGYGYRARGVVIAQEAVNVYRTMCQAATDEDTQRPLWNLATALTNLGKSLALGGQYEQGYQALEEAMDLYRQLAETGGEAYLPDLAIALHNLSHNLKRQRDLATALRMAHEAVTTLLPYYTQHRDTCAHWMSQLVINYKGLCASLGQQPDQDIVRDYDRYDDETYC